ncbi:hypothetical protein ACIQVO_31715 [Streptomyces sp. NPDC101062]|uniref:hypothetical protein n=1 Tax=unclassified Streptomyces TaxID=2593676 RepID=UPI0037FB6494
MAAGGELLEERLALVWVGAHGGLGDGTGQLPRGALASSARSLLRGLLRETGSQGDGLAGGPVARDLGCIAVALSNSKAGEQAFADFSANPGEDAVGDGLRLAEV